MATTGTLDVLLLVALVLAPAVVLVVFFRLLAWLRDDEFVDRLQSAESGTPPERSPRDVLRPDNERRADEDRRESRRACREDDAIRCRTCGTENVPHATYCRRCVSEL